MPHVYDARDRDRINFPNAHGGGLGAPHRLQVRTPASLAAACAFGPDGGGSKAISETDQRGTLRCEGCCSVHLGGV